MSQSKIHGALPILGEAEARANVQVYLNEVDQGSIRTYEDYILLTGKEGVKLPQALGSLVFHHGQPGFTRAVHGIKQRHQGWSFEASALRTSRLTNVELQRHHRYAHIGQREQSQLFFLADDPASGFASQETGHIYRSYQPNSFWQTRRAAFAPEELTGFLAVSQVLIQNLLDSTAVKS